MQQQQRMKNGGIVGAVMNGVNRYRAAQAQAQAGGAGAPPPPPVPGSPANQMDASPVSGPAMTPSPAPSAPQAPNLSMDDGSPQISNGIMSASPESSSNSYLAAGAGGGAAASGADDDAFNAMDGVEMLSQGALVTKPMIAKVGEAGPEAVIPLTDQPSARVSSDMLGQGLGMRSRWRRPTGPNASARYKPESADIPLRPGLVTR
jgi:hypothetical protein